MQQKWVYMLLHSDLVLESRPRWRGMAVHCFEIHPDMRAGGQPGRGQWGDMSKRCTLKIPDDGPMALAAEVWQVFSLLFSPNKIWRGKNNLPPKIVPAPRTLRGPGEWAGANDQPLALTAPARQALLLSRSGCLHCYPLFSCLGVKGPVTSFLIHPLGKSPDFIPTPPPHSQKVKQLSF